MKRDVILKRVNKIKDTMRAIGNISREKMEYSLSTLLSLNYYEELENRIVAYVVKKYWADDHEYKTVSEKYLTEYMESYLNSVVLLSLETEPISRALYLNSDSVKNFITLFKYCVWSDCGFEIYKGFSPVNGELMLSADYTSKKHVYRIDWYTKGYKSSMYVYGDTDDCENKDDMKTVLKKAKELFFNIMLDRNANLCIYLEKIEWVDTVDCGGYTTAYVDECVLEMNFEAFKKRFNYAVSMLGHGGYEVYTLTDNIEFYEGRALIKSHFGFVDNASLEADSNYVMFKNVVVNTHWGAEVIYDIFGAEPEFYQGE